MSSFFYAIKNLLTAYHIDKSSTGKIIEPSRPTQIAGWSQANGTKRSFNEFYGKN